MKLDRCREKGLVGLIGFGWGGEGGPGAEGQSATWFGILVVRGRGLGRLMFFMGKKYWGAGGKKSFFDL